jgi:segregation and condensation protein B
MAMDNGNFDNIVLALLFSADEPLTVRKISSILEDAESSDIHESIARWQKKLDDESWSIVLERVAGGYQLSTRPEYAPFIARLYSGRRKLRLSKAALETMAIIAYKQPITRADIENVRGVGCGSVISNLMERSLIRITGKAKVLGAPFLYGTTQEFLEYLGLNALKDLPSLEELEALLEREENAVSESGDRSSAGAAGISDEEVEESASGVVAGAADEPIGSEAEPEELIPEETDAAVPNALDDPEADAPVKPHLPSAARLGPNIEEPYHRPLGDDGDDPIWTDAETTAEDEEADGEEQRRVDRFDDRDD